MHFSLSFPSAPARLVTSRQQFHLPSALILLSSHFVTPSHYDTSPSITVNFAALYYATISIPPPTDSRSTAHHRPTSLRRRPTLTSPRLPLLSFPFRHLPPLFLSLTTHLYYPPAASALSSRLRLSLQPSSLYLSLCFLSLSLSRVINVCFPVRLPVCLE